VGVCSSVEAVFTILGASQVPNLTHEGPIQTHKTVKLSGLVMEN